MTRINSQFSMIFLFTLLLVGCGRYDEEILNLETRLSDAETQLSQANDSNNNTAFLVEQGSCTLVDITEESALLSCGDGTQFLIKNGTDGENGQNVSTASYEYLYPCGDQSKEKNNVIIKLDDGTLIGHFANGKKSKFLSILMPGEYRVNGKDKCKFSITDDFQVLKE